MAEPHLPLKLNITLSQLLRRFKTFKGTFFHSRASIKRLLHNNEKCCLLATYNRKQNFRLLKKPRKLRAYKDMEIYLTGVHFQR